MNPYEDIRDMSHVALEDPYDMEQWNTFNLDAPPRAGLYECIVMDPPWNIPLAQSKTAYSRYAKALGKGRHKDEYLAGVADELPYDTMTQNQLLKMPIERWAAPNCHLLIWCTRGTMNDASHLMRHYGFRELTTLAWNKKGGMCNWRIHQNIDYIKYGIRGRRSETLPRSTLHTLYAESATSHSKKPPGIYRMWRVLFPGPRLDVFCRLHHDGYDGWGNEYEGAPKHEQALLEDVVECGIAEPLTLEVHT